MRADFVAVPGGVIELRDDRIGRKWRVELQPFMLGKYLVTQDLFATITGRNPSSFVGDRRPVENVSWYDAVGFCNALSEQEGLSSAYQIGAHLDDVSLDPKANGYRLPSDAEWQFAGLGGQQGPLYGEISDIAWFSGTADETTHDVGLKMPNAYGLYDMVGNVWEWCFDLYDPKVYGSYRIFRGGGWNDPERHCLLTNRRRSHPTFAIDDLGFRLARSLGCSDGPLGQEIAPFECP